MSYEEAEQTFGHLTLASIDFYDEKFNVLDDAHENEMIGVMMTFVDVHVNIVYLVYL